MKKILLAGVVLVLLGCKESETGLQKNVINTVYDNCYQKLTTVVKSPSSLRIKNSLFVNHYPNIDDINRIFGSALIKDNQISKQKMEDKIRFRQIKMIMSYEAQNSFGVYLPGDFECIYTYELSEQNTSPDKIVLSNIDSGDEKINLAIEISDFDNVSNTQLKSIGKITDVGDGNKFTSQDNELYAKIIDFNKEQKVNLDIEKDVQKFKESMGWY